MTIDLSGFVPRRTKITIGSKEFTFTELTLADLAEFKQHLRQQREELNAVRRKRLLTEAAAIGGIDSLELLKLTDTTISNEEFEQQSETIEGIGFLAFCSLRRSHEGISRDQVMGMITTDDIEKVTKAMFPEKEKDTEKKTPDKPKKKK